MSKIIIVCGQPGTGKTLLAEELSKKLNIICLHKDVFKETLYEELELSTLEDSKNLGKVSVSLLLRIASEIIDKQIDVIIESPFNFSDRYELFKTWDNNPDLDLYTIICTINDQERIQRIRERPRHKAHHDGEREIFPITEEKNKVYDTIPGKQIRLETNRDVQILVLEIIDQFDFGYTPPKRPVGSGALFLNQAGELLLVKPAYKKGWLIPGGSVEEESPREACQREVKEEIGLTIPITKLLTIDSITYQPHRRAGLQFTFYGGMLDEEQIKKINLPSEELSEFIFVPLEQLSDYLRESKVSRYKLSLKAYQENIIYYLEDGKLASL